MNVITFIGLAATGVSISSMLPQVIQCWRTKSTKDISLQAFSLMVTGSILWFTYGILQKDAIIYIANFIYGLLSFSIIVAKLKYK
ncbi:MAG TPA: SemiSWEET family transporter [Patescibacteria group bacterium]|jgi:MtN3 and saliva related transmembrane protein|nr:SemiSWEET family transporter [Patescibacteria group bacterium]